MHLRILTVAMGVCASLRLLGGGELHSTLYGLENLVAEPLTATTGTLQDGHVYYLTNSLSFVGADAASSAEKGGAGLTVASGARVYIYIPPGLTLACTGGCGKAASNGGAGASPTITQSQTTYKGITYPILSYGKGAAGSGGTPATGGGAGIALPEDASLSVFGRGALSCTGGAGGAAGGGGGTGSGSYYCYSYATYSDADEKKVLHNEYFYSSDPADVFVQPAITGTITGTGGVTDTGGCPASAGGGGGGAGGGGAAIGTAGTDGTFGTDGAIPEDWDSTDGTGMQVVASSNAAVATSAKDAGKLWLASGLNESTLVGGAGGAASDGVQSFHASVTNGCQRIRNVYWDDLDDELVVTYGTQLVYRVASQGGGAGGRGGAGAAYGAGGQGGCGGRGGDAGAYAASFGNDATALPGTANIGTVGAVGTNAAARSHTELDVSQEPFGRVRFTDDFAADPDVRTYSFGRGISFTMPVANRLWWTTNCAATAAGLGTDASALTQLGVCTVGGATVTASSAAYGDATFSSGELRVEYATGLSGPLAVSAADGLYTRRLEGRSLAVMRTAVSGTGANGIPVWQSYVLGLADDDAAAKYGLAARQSAAVDALALDATGSPRTEAGFAVRWRLDRRSFGAAAWTEGVFTETGLPTLPLADGASGERRIVAAFRPTSGTQPAGDIAWKTVATENAVGILAVTAATTNTILAVPFAGFALRGETGAVAITNLVKAANLSSGDSCCIYDFAAGRYEIWTLGEESGTLVWRPGKSVYVDGTGETTIVEPTIKALSRGSAFWLSRRDPARTAWLFGEVATNALSTTVTAGTSEDPVFHLLASPVAGTAHALSDIVTTCEGVCGDSIVIPANGPPRVFTSRKGRWGVSASRVVTGPDGQPSVVTERDETPVEIPPGTGFWYVSRGGAPTIEWSREVK